MGEESAIGRRKGEPPTVVVMQEGQRPHGCLSSFTSG